MDRTVERIIVIQTAFIGDVILTLPLIQILRKKFPSARLDVVVVPRAANLLDHHPAVSNIVPYDKRGRQRGLGGFMEMVRRLRAERYDLALVPHRSLRSAALARASKVPVCIGFRTSVGRMLMTATVPYLAGVHEVERNMALLKPLGIDVAVRELPTLYPSAADEARVDAWLTAIMPGIEGALIGVAPGTIWNTKRWPKERFALVAQALAAQGNRVVLIGGPEDASLAGEIASTVNDRRVATAAGALTLLESAALIRRCQQLITNDSAPMHMAVAMRTPVIALFGATVPAFGFAPYGEHDTVVETNGLSCRPCSIHGGDRCPIGTFDCMLHISADRVVRLVNERTGVR
ncbi:MAG TPA: putative lipopolysaccharide heptosyltransferase III [Bacteroidota bacterium]|nr:putative lipopolysaccharide heptosyltransferase III [Bacteroidota bacterium]